MRMMHFLNGKWVTDAELKIPATDLSVIRGFGIFDFLRTYNKIPFRIDDHISRLFVSAKILGIRIPKKKEEIRKIVEKGLRLNDLPDLTIKMLVTGGSSPDGISPGEALFIVIFGSLPVYPVENYTRGVKILSFPYFRFLPEVKSFNYLPAVYSMQKATKQKAVEVLYIDEKQIVRECTRSNIFFVKGNTLITPTEQSILKGVTRKVVIELATKKGIAVTERDIRVKELSGFDECFITGSTIEILPTVKIDSTKIGSGRVGPVTRAMMDYFRSVTS